MNSETTIHIHWGLVWNIHTNGEKTIAKITIRGQEYSGQVSNPEGTVAPDEWIEWSLLEGLYDLFEHGLFEYYEAIRMLHMHCLSLPAMY